MKKTIHAITILDKSGSMSPFKGRTLEGLNSNILALKKEVDENTDIISTLVQFSSNGCFSQSDTTRDFIFSRLGKSILDVSEMRDQDYCPDGGTPLLDAIGVTIDKIKEFHGDSLGDDNLKFIVTIFTDGEENSSTKFSHEEIKKMIEHFQSDGKWTFTFVGCGSIDSVNSVSNSIGIGMSNTVAYSCSDAGYADGFEKVTTSYCNYARSVKMGTVDTSLFEKK